MTRTTSRNCTQSHRLPKKLSPLKQQSPPKSAAATPEKSKAQVIDSTEDYCAEVRTQEIQQLHGLLTEMMAAEGPQMMCVTGPPGTGKTKTISCFLQYIARQNCSILRAAGVTGDGMNQYDSAACCFVQAFSLNSIQRKVASSAEFQLAESIVSSCSSKGTAQKFRRQLLRGATEAETMLDCVPALAQVIPPCLFLAVDEIDRLFSIQLACNTRRSQRRARRLTPLHFLAHLAVKASESPTRSKVILIGISNDAQIAADIRLLNLYNVQEIVFEPYSFSQLNQLVRYRHQTPELARSLPLNVAIEYGSRKIANSTGDCRQIMDMMSRLQLSTHPSRETSPTRVMTEASVDTEHAVKRVQRILGVAHQTEVSRLVELIEALTVQQQTIACALAKLIYAHEREKSQLPTESGGERAWINVSAVRASYHALCRVMVLHPLSAAAFQNNLDSLMTEGLIESRRETPLLSTPGPSIQSRRKGRGSSVNRQRTPIKTVQKFLTPPSLPASPEFGRNSKIFDATLSNWWISFTMHPRRIRALLEKLKHRKISRVFALVMLQDNASSEEDL
eukprot:Gregarina_sp_Poly_1__10626@NODE_797_length_6255_cov_204_266968_g583_i0_p2_GENE_NODE_797_length_6255_cov_204_266968_g583_i0NODE_797_length_6255_cov_204_266968_g583_i0_p2_ORF_typecomplete_len563_score72_66AAA_16/PF13191_6/9_3e09AAA_16/PF13191_6/4_4e03AAA_22/PF13401_6/3_9e08AAA_30/PF13604_6/6_4e07AAA_30/PF13604_6/1_5e03AAA_19/PF13245_6/1_9e05AAA_19/PF13245_6/4_3e02AAA_11/PF13086_6/2_4e06AAA_11/PF13086_6/3e03AAA/PF00004_29/1_2e05DUF2791/PF10923_8/0_00011DUF2791/PF10923_8/1_1e02T2SSE/PF00437_20/6_5e0